jgi:hypothetical protein
MYGQLDPRVQVYKYKRVPSKSRGRYRRALSFFAPPRITKPFNVLAYMPYCQQKRSRKRSQHRRVATDDLINRGRDRGDEEGPRKALQYSYLCDRVTRAFRRGKRQATTQCKVYPRAIFPKKEPPPPPKRNDHKGNVHHCVVLSHESRLGSGPA